MPLSLLLSVQDRLEQDISLLVQGLALQSLNLPPLNPSGNPGIGSNVFTQMLPEQLNVIQFPAVLVSSFGERARDEGSTFEQRLVIYPIRVTILDVAQPYFQSRRGDYEWWSQQIAATLEGLTNYPLFPDVPECYAVDVEELTSIDPRLPESQFFRGGLVAHCRTSRYRQHNPGLGQ